MYILKSHHTCQLKFQEDFSLKSKDEVDVQCRWNQVMRIGPYLFTN